MHQPATVCQDNVIISSANIRVCLKNSVLISVLAGVFLDTLSMCVYASAGVCVCVGNCGV